MNTHPDDILLHFLVIKFSQLSDHLDVSGKVSNHCYYKTAYALKECRTQ